VPPPVVVQATRTLAAGPDPFTGTPNAFGIGFQVQTHARTLGPVARAYGHTGMGGSVHGAWPDHGIGFSYCMNRMRDADLLDPRAGALLDALAAVTDRI
jgi:CubicO group peptidase (beta-lactamase class C family)